MPIATIKTLFELCGENVAAQIRGKKVNRIRRILGIRDDEQDNPVMTKPCAQQVLSNLPLSQLLELDSITLFKLASEDLWRSRTVLALVGPGFMLERMEPCCEHRSHLVGPQDIVRCTQKELNLAAFGDPQKQCPKRFLALARKCTNLKTIYWDIQFAQLIDDNFVSILNSSFPKLQHIQGESEHYIFNLPSDTMRLECNYLTWGSYNFEHQFPNNWQIELDLLDSQPTEAI